MASLARPSSPNSLRLRLGFRSRESSSFFLRVRFRPSNPRIVISFAAGDVVKSGNVGRSWSGSDGLPDAYAGWAATGSGAGKSNKKGRLREILGAGLAGILFAVGVTFATLTFINKISSGAKHQFDSLSDQEILSTSYDATEDDQADKVADVIPTYNESMISDYNEYNVTVRDQTASLNLNDQEVEWNAGNAPVVSSLSSNRSELPPWADDFSSYSSKSIDLLCSTTADKLELVAGYDMNVNSTLYSRESGSQVSIDSLKSYDKTVESNNKIDFQSSFESVVASAVSLLRTRDIEQNNLLQLPMEDRPNYPEFGDLNDPAQQVLPGKVLVPAVVDLVQGQALEALQVLKVIEVDAQPGDICTRREYARWLVSASNIFSRSTSSKVYPAMYIENLTELAFDDVVPEDPDFPCIQGLAEAGLISSKLSKPDFNGSDNVQDYVLFSPDSPVTRQDLVCWKMVLERRQLPVVDKNQMYQLTGYADINKIRRDAWPALVADVSAGEQSITALAFGYTRLFQPNKPVTKAQAAVAITTGDAAEAVSEELARIEAELLAETIVNAHTALVAQVEKGLNARFEEELAKARGKTRALEKLAEETRQELERLRTQREEEKDALIRDRAVVESEMEVLSGFRHEVEEKLQSLMSKKLEISSERDKITKLQKEVESENEVIIRLQYELEIERKALFMARVWAEEEAKLAREQARALEEARQRWERRGIGIVVDEDLQNDASIGVTWYTAGEHPPVDETIGRGEDLIKRLKEIAVEMKHRSSLVVDKVIQRILDIVSALKQRASEVSEHATVLGNVGISKAKGAMNDFKEGASGFSQIIGDKTKKIFENCREGVGKISQKFKT